jgi:hypothetical protein
MKIIHRVCFDRCASRANRKTIKMPTFRENWAFLRSILPFVKFFSLISLILIPEFTFTGFCFCQFLNSVTPVARILFPAGQAQRRASVAAGRLAKDTRSVFWKPFGSRCALLHPAHGYFSAESHDSPPNPLCLWQFGHIRMRLQARFGRHRVSPRAGAETRSQI